MLRVSRTPPAAARVMTRAAADDGGGDQTGQPSDAARDALLAAILALYLLTDAQVAALTEAIREGMLDAYVGSVADAVDALGATLADGWTPPAGDAAAIDAEAEQAAASIAQTYHDDLSGALDGLITAYFAAHPDASITTARGAIEAQAEQWAEERGAWKAAQVAAWETGLAAAAGLGYLAEALLGDLGDDPLALPDGLAPDDVVVVVLPDESSGDDCVEWAGRVFALDACDDLPIPRHPACIHYKVLMTRAEALG